MNVGYFIARSAQYFPEKTAFVVDGRARSYAELDRRINKLANALLALGLRKGDRVGLLFHNSYGYLESHLALYKAGLVWVRLNARLSSLELKGMMEDSGAVALIHGPEFGETAGQISAGLEWVIREGEGPGLSYEDCLQRGGDQEPEVDVGPDDLSDLWYTSGTTGAPKGIMLTHRNIMTCTQFLLSDIYDITSEDKFQTAGALSHAGSVRILPFIIRGATCFLHSHFDPEKCLEETEREKITDWAVVPTMLIAIMDHPAIGGYDLGSLKRITYAGSPLPVERIKEGLKRFGPVLDQSYGQAESIITITHLSRQDHIECAKPGNEGRLASAGREYPGVRVKIVDEQNRELPAGEFGEVATRSDLVMRGYWNQAQRTAEVLKDGWLHTGDIGYLDEEGYLYLVDRKNDKIITGGMNVFPREVEEVISTHGSVAQVAVFGAKDPYWGEAVTAAIVPRAGARLQEGEIIAFCKERLAGYKRPKRVVLLGELPKNLYGKVMRKDLKRMYEEGMESVKPGQGQVLRQTDERNTGEAEFTQAPDRGDRL